MRPMADFVRDVVIVSRSAVFIRREVERLKQVLPRQVAYEQVAWLLDQRVARLQREGLNRAQIAEVLGVTASVIDRRLHRASARKGRRSPLERYLADNTDIIAMAAESIPHEMLPPVLRSWARTGDAPPGAKLSPVDERLPPLRRPAIR